MKHPDKKYLSRKSKFSNDTKFNPKEITEFLGLLGHKNLGLTEVRIIDVNESGPSKIKGIGFFDSGEKLIEEYQKWNRKANIYAGMNPRPARFKKEYPKAYNKINPFQKEGGKSKDIEYITAFSLDIDPVRPKGMASTNEEHECAIDMGKEIFSEDPGSCVLDSGNGVCVIYPVKPYRVDSDYQILEAKIRVWQQRIRHRVEGEEKLKLDSTYDLARLIKIPGTLSVKGKHTKNRPHRIAKILTKPSQPHSAVIEEILKLEAAISGKSHVNLTTISKVIPPRFRVILSKDKKLKATWEGKRKDLKDQTRSGYDMALANQLVKHGFSDSEIAAIIKQSPSGKGTDATVQYFALTISKAKTKSREDTKKKIQKYRKSFKGLKLIEKLQMISQLIREDLKTVGSFYVADSEQFFFEKSSKTLMNIEGPEFTTLLNTEYGTNKAEHEYKFVLADIEAEVRKNGKQTEVYRFAYYDKANFILYIFNNESQVYKVAEHKVELVDNGTDGILFFKDPGCEKLEFIKDAKITTSILDKYLVDRINFVKGEGVNLSPQEQAYLFINWFFSLFFESILPTKPILVFIGVKGSGKTFILRSIGRILFGMKFNVTTLSKDKRDLVSVITNNYFVAIDNADTKIPWLNDLLASTATGQAISYRKLYTSNEEIRFYPRVFMALTSRTPYFKRDDVADRLLIFKVERIENFISEDVLLKDILQNRDLLWTEIIRDLQKILKILKKPKNINYKTGFRLADWATLAARMTDNSNYIETLLEKMEQEQSAFTLEGDPICELLPIWLDNENYDKQISTGDLYKALIQIASNESIDFYYKNSRSFGMRLKHILPNLENILGITIMRRTGSGNKKIYIFQERNHGKNS